MAQGDPGCQHQAAGMKPRPKIGKTFHNVSFGERRVPSQGQARPYWWLDGDCDRSPAVGRVQEGQTMILTSTVARECLCYHFCYPTRRHAMERAGMATYSGMPFSRENTDSVTRHRPGRDSRWRTA